MNPAWKRIVDAATSHRTPLSLRRVLDLYLGQRLPRVLAGRDAHDDAVIDAVGAYLLGRETEQAVVDAVLAARAAWGLGATAESSARRPPQSAIDRPLTNARRS